jgi:outer membrane protein OmpA-like peptidoglycan-associated protein
MKKALLLIIGLCILFFLKCQELILNGDFEDVNICSEYAQPCSPHAWRLTSVNLPIYNLDGNKFVKIAVCNTSVPNIRAYLEARIGDTLLVGETYIFSMDIKPVDMLINQIGVLFSEKLITTRVDTLINLEPDIVFGKKNKLLLKSKRKKWTRLEAEFIATSPDTYILIGCFVPEHELRKGRHIRYKYYKNYYYAFDNISLVPKNENIHNESEIEDIAIHVYSQNHRHPVSETLFSEQSLKKQNPIEVAHVVTQKNDTIVLSSSLLFGFDSYEINTAMIGTLDSVFIFSQTPPKKVIITGHTDNIGDDNYNDKLSLLRAEAIGNYFSINVIIPEERIVCIGKGKQCPVSDNNTEEGRQKNRRVEIVIEY